eukprot:TRINITY_DN1914_c1_g1_i4.p1 TRINITY_DN1914_c1_g1~~TRINITY_DN1914_c1_g1_i4.p1  ORF type:complete len:177 (-),score=38.30 TRINITY_DN1914_c1_g1_i4:428-958(-)
MPEVHLIGEIDCGWGFDARFVFCKWKVVFGSPQWTKVLGSEKGTTHVVKKLVDRYVFSHPIDIHLATKAMEGWPRILVQVWRQDMFGRNDFCGYSLVHVPMKPGTYELECPTWRPVGTVCEEISAFFLGGVPQLRDEETILTGEDRWQLRTKSTGSVRIKLSVVMKDFAKHGVLAR